MTVQDAVSKTHQPPLLRFHSGADMAKNPKAKKRNEYVYATTNGEVSEIGVTVNSLTGEIRFGNEMTNVYSEVNYDRPKDPKILSRIPQAHQDISFDAWPALERNFDFLCAVDTNTRNIQGMNLSVVGVVTFQSVWVPEKQGLTRYWKFDVPFCLEYVRIKSKPENFGWLAALEHLKKFGHVDHTCKVGMVVDSDLGNISDYNRRKKPVDGPDYLPENVQLVAGILSIVIASKTMVRPRFFFPDFCAFCQDSI